MYIDIYKLLWIHLHFHFLAFYRENTFLNMMLKKTTTTPCLRVSVSVLFINDNEREN